MKTSSFRPLVGNPRRFNSAFNSTTVFSRHPFASALLAVPVAWAADFAAALAEGVEWICAICPCGPGDRARREGADLECLNVRDSIEGLIVLLLRFLGFFTTESNTKPRRKYSNDQDCQGSLIIENRGMKKKRKKGGMRWARDGGFVYVCSRNHN